MIYYEAEQLFLIFYAVCNLREFHPIWDSLGFLIVNMASNLDFFEGWEGQSVL